MTNEEIARRARYETVKHNTAMAINNLIEKAADDLEGDWAPFDAERFRDEVLELVTGEDE